MANRYGVALLFELPADVSRHLAVVFHQQNLHRCTRDQVTVSSR